MTGRDAALRALYFFRKQKIASEDALVCGDLPLRERALAARLFYGVLQNMLYIDWCISQFTNFASLEPRVLDVLRLGVYQMYFLDKIPAAAAVNEAVKMVKRYTPRAAALVNAVLRRLSEKRPIPPEDKRYLFCSLPEWLYSRLEDVLGKEETMAFGKAINCVPPVFIFSKQPINGLLEHPWLKDCYTHKGDVTGILADKAAVVADPGAVLAVMALAPNTGEYIWDSCAAPGGKSFIMSMMSQAHILSTDINAKKLAVMEQTRIRLGVTNVEIRQADARSGPGKSDIGELYFDGVLCDVPCSGFGVMRKKPDIRFKKQEEIERLPSIQLEILRRAAQYVKPGGRLVYVTCTVLGEENQDVIMKFLEENTSFAREAFTLPAPVGTVESGDITLWPHRYDTDGFYICRLRRKCESVD